MGLSAGGRTGLVAVQDLSQGPRVPGAHHQQPEGKGKGALSCCSGSWYIDSHSCLIAPSSLHRQPGQHTCLPGGQRHKLENERQESQGRETEKERDTGDQRDTGDPDRQTDRERKDNLAVTAAGGSVNSIHFGLRGRREEGGTRARSSRSLC